MQSSLFTAAIAVCVFAGGILSDKKISTGRPAVYFTWFLVIETLGFILELLMSHPASPLKALWLGLRMGTSLLVAPCLWLAIKESVEGIRSPLSSLNQRHYAVIAAGIAFTIPLIASAHFGLDYHNPERVTTQLQSRIIHTTMLLCISIFALQVPFYLWRCRAILLQQSNRRRLTTQSDAAPSLAWLHLPLAVVFTTWLLGILRTVQCATHAPREFTLLFALTEVSVTVGALYTIVRQKSSMEPLPVDTEPETNEEEEAEAPPQSKYAKSNLAPAIRKRIKEKLTMAMEHTEICRDSLINLRSLSREIKENAHYVSQVISQDLGSNFYELVNRHRIDRAKKLLADAPDQSVLEIALAVGFNSKSTFNAAFRRITGKTPSQYRLSSEGNPLKAEFS